MQFSDQVEQIRNVTAPLAHSLGLLIWGVEVIEAGRPLVRIYVDVQESVENSNGVTIDQCAELSRLVGISLEVEDIFPAEWTLEVSSPGLERPFFQLEQLRGYCGRELEVSLVTPTANWSHRKNFCGILHQVKADSFTLYLPLLPVARRKVDEPETVDIPWTLVRKASLVPIFPESGQKKHAK